MPIRRRDLWLASAVALILVRADAACGGEFRPLDMPDQKSQYRTQQYQAPMAPEQNFDGVYSQFRADIRGKTPAERESLKRTFQARREEAIKQQRWEEVRYYTGLLDILGK